MTPPKKIYLYPDVGDKSLVKIWTKDQIFKSGLPYFSEDAVKEAIKQVIDDANHLVDISTTVHKTKLDAEKYIPHIMELLLKGGKNG